MKTQPTVPYHDQSYENTLEFYNSVRICHQSIHCTERPQSSVSNTPKNNQHPNILIPLITLPRSTILQRSGSVKKLKCLLPIHVQSIHSPTMPCNSPTAEYVRTQSIFPCHSQSLENSLIINAKTTNFKQDSVSNTPKNNQHRHHLIALTTLSHSIRVQSIHSPNMPCNSPTAISTIPISKKA
jgi:hypothetical protein